MMGMTKSQEDAFCDWMSFYRDNPHIFAKEFLGVRLFPFQVFLLWAMNKYSFFTYIAARGQGKSFLIAIYCVVRAILWPDTNVVLASGTEI